jgi:hypothetical protein
LCSLSISPATLAMMWLSTRATFGL